jgi:signal transduction histidine kinase
VLDRGPGIAERASESDTARRGLGLEIARSFAAANGGQVTLANRPGGGAIARVDLPAAVLPAVVEAPQA